MVAAHSRWRAVAETSDLRAWSAPRVRFLCLDADETHVVLNEHGQPVRVRAAPRVADATGYIRTPRRGCRLGRDSSSDDQRPARVPCGSSRWSLPRTSPIEPPEDPNPEPETERDPTAARPIIATVTPRHGSCTRRCRWGGGL